MTGPTSSSADPKAPKPVSVVSTSRAADTGFLTLADLAQITTALGLDYRIVGGHMVTLLVALHGVSEQVPLRETADADFAALPSVIADPRLPGALLERGYRSREAANRFTRDSADEYGQLSLVIDILAPSYRGALVPNQRHGDLVVDEVPGLVLALHRPAELLDVDVQLTNKGHLSMCVALPDVTSALCLKALAYRGRFAPKDAVDLWRLIHAAHAAGLRTADWPVSITGRQAADVLHRFFGTPDAAGLKQMSSSIADRTRMRALVREIVPAG
ncbi:hypothetical protein RM555_15395 [Micromonospora sp. DSM 115977]|uniref:Nucleotidyl transferase AbiEii toxin, Type IV TA system n=1 Tax=Micromonospora reichwaldensis TaxID=3075516 RepID=A0ABU2WXX1_9ACTN|nr:hypothetical protein [Micromonospora sp. DSM 115977]MDT0530375.1 hypothetical protein [Micromonospora sp. DSM 115977]